MGVCERPKWLLNYCFRAFWHCFNPKKQSTRLTPSLYLCRVHIWLLQKVNYWIFNIIPLWILMSIIDKRTNFSSYYSLKINDYIFKALALSLLSLLFAEYSCSSVEKVKTTVPTIWFCKNILFITRYLCCAMIFSLKT